MPNLFDGDGGCSRCALLPDLCTRFARAKSLARQPIPCEYLLRSWIKPSRDKKRGKSQIINGDNTATAFAGARAG